MSERKNYAAMTVEELQAELPKVHERHHQATLEFLRDVAALQLQLQSAVNRAHTDKARREWNAVYKVTEGGSELQMMATEMEQKFAGDRFNIYVGHKQDLLAAYECQPYRGRAVDVRQVAGTRAPLAVDLIVQRYAMRLMGIRQEETRRLQEEGR